MLEKDQAGDILEARLRIGKVLADIAEGAGPQQRIGQRMREDVGVGMTHEPLEKGDLHPAEDQLPVDDKAVHVVADAEARHLTPGGSTNLKAVEAASLAAPGDLNLSDTGHAGPAAHGRHQLFDRSAFSFGDDFDTPVGPVPDVAAEAEPLCSR